VFILGFLDEVISGEDYPHDPGEGER